MSVQHNNQEQQVPVSKIAYVNAVADTVTDAGLAQWPSAAHKSAAVHKLASLLQFDPVTHRTNEKLAGQVAVACIKTAESMCEEEEKKDPKEEAKKARKDALKEMGDEEEKKAALSYWDLLDRASIGAQKIAAAAMASDGQEPGTGAPGNSRTEAAKSDPVAAQDLRNRPEGYAENPPSSETPANATVGSEQPHPKAGDVGKVANEILSEIITESTGKRASMASDGQEPGTGAPGNSRTEAAKSDPVAAQDLRNRPEGYAENPPSSETPANATVGSEQPHPKAGDVGKTAQARFESAVKTARVHPVFEMLDKEEKIAHCKQIMNLPSAQQSKYLDKLYTRKAGM